jgi:hypothetical protein
MESAVSEELGFQELDEEIRAAQDALLETLRRSPEDWWDARELREETRNGVKWPGEVMTFALTDLVNQGRLELDPELRVKIKSS